MYGYKHYPAAWVLRAAVLFFVVGAWIRCISDINRTFIPLLAGNAVISVGYVMLSVAITLIANRWFTDRERETVIAICGIAIPSGNLVSFVWTGLAFRNCDPTSPASVYHDLYQMLFVQAVFYSAITIPFVIFIRSAPDLPPSVVATKNPEETHFCQTI